MIRHLIMALTVGIMLGITDYGHAQGYQSAEAPALEVRAAVWGEVNRPGQYSLSGSPDLLELISMGGGPTAAADINRVIVIREQDGSRHTINLNRLARSGKRFFIVSGDVVVIPQSFWSRFRQGLPVITAAAAVANVVITVILLGQR